MEKKTELIVSGLGLLVAVVSLVLFLRRGSAGASPATVIAAPTQTPADSGNLSTPALDTSSGGDLAALLAAIEQQQSGGFGGQIAGAGGGGAIVIPPDYGTVNSPTPQPSPAAPAPTTGAAGGDKTPAGPLPSLGMIQAASIAAGVYQTPIANLGIGGVPNPVTGRTGVDPYQPTPPSGDPIVPTRTYDSSPPTETPSTVLAVAGEHPVIYTANLPSRDLTGRSPAATVNPPAEIPPSAPPTAPAAQPSGINANRSGTPSAGAPGTDTGGPVQPPTAPAPITAASGSGIQANRGGLPSKPGTLTGHLLNGLIGGSV